GDGVRRIAGRAADELEDGVDPFLTKRLDLRLDPCLDIEMLDTVDDDELAAALLHELLRERKRSLGRVRRVGCPDDGLEHDSLLQAVASTGTRVSRTIRTGRLAACRIPRETLPSRALETAPSPRDPTTIRSASIESA